MSQYLSDIGFANAKEIAERIRALSLGWMPETLGLSYNRLINDFSDKDLPELHGIQTFFTDLSATLTGDFIPENLVQQNNENTAPLPATWPKAPPAPSVLTEINNATTFFETTPNDTVRDKITYPAELQKLTQIPDSPDSDIVPYIVESQNKPVANQPDTFKNTSLNNTDNNTGALTILSDPDAPRSSAQEKSIGNNWNSESGSYAPQSVSTVESTGNNRNNPLEGQLFQTLGKLGDMTRLNDVTLLQNLYATTGIPESGDLQNDTKTTEWPIASPNPPNDSHHQNTPYANPYTPPPHPGELAQTTASNKKNFQPKEEQRKGINIDDVLNELAQKLQNEYKRFYGD